MLRYDYIWLGLFCLYVYIHSRNFVQAEPSGTNKNIVNIDKLRQLETHLLGLVAKIAEQNVKIANMETRIANQVIRITNQDLKFSEQDYQIANQDRKISEQDAKVSNQEAEIANQDSKILAQDAKLADKETEISNLKRKITNQDIKIMNQDITIANQNTKISDQDVKIAKQDAKLISLKTEIAIQSTGTAKHNETLSINVFPQCHLKSQFTSVQNASDLLEKYSDNLMKAIEILQGVTNTSCISGKGPSISKETPKDCEEIKTRFPASESGVYAIYPGLSNSSMQVFCDMDTDGGGWTVFQSRKDGSVDFERTWNDYADGFGNLTGEFWLGNDNIHRLVSTSPYMLRVDMEDFEGERRFANYSTFSVAGKDDKYKLTVGGYSGDAGNAMGYHNQMKFSTTDNDNDLTGSNCAVSYRGAWWYNECHNANLNGFYYKTNPSPSSKGINWNQWKEFKYSLKAVTLKIKRL